MSRVRRWSKPKAAGYASELPGVGTPGSKLDGRTEDVLNRTLKRATALIALLASCIPLACSSDDDEAPKGSRGQFCQSRSDCADKLACIDNTCVDAVFGVAPLQKECVPIQCRTAEDCKVDSCNPPAICDYYEEQCALDNTSIYCDSYAAQCLCADENWACEENKCVETCTSIGQLCQNGGTCNGTRCVECTEDEQCNTDQACRDNRCETACEEDLDCPVFYSCQNRECVETGCKSDRECIAAERDVRAFCDANAKCQVPCKSDIECGNPYNYGHRSCVDGLCIDVGCESDQECRIIFATQIEGGAIDAICRDKPATAAK